MKLQSLLTCIIEPPSHPPLSSSHYPLLILLPPHTTTLPHLHPPTFSSPPLPSPPPPTGQLVGNMEDLIQLSFDLTRWHGPWASDIASGILFLFLFPSIILFWFCYLNTISSLLFAKSHVKISFFLFFLHKDSEMPKLMLPCPHGSEERKNHTWISCSRRSKNQKELFWRRKLIHSALRG